MTKGENYEMVHRDTSEPNKIGQRLLGQHEEAILAGDPSAISEALAGLAELMLTHADSLEEGLGLEIANVLDASLAS